MAVLKNVELFFAKLDPEKPNSTFDSNNPTWEVQIRTRDKKVAKQWKDLNINVRTDDDDDGVFYKANLKKKTKKANGTPQAPVKLLGGDLSDIDPNILGNGSIGNVRVYQYPYSVGGREGVASMLMAVQVTTLKKYEPKPREDDFEITEMKIVEVADNQDLSEEMVDKELDDELTF
jgi:hypothetical protein